MALASKLSGLLRSKFASDAAWSGAAFFTMAVSALTLNLAIDHAFGAAGLGVFGQVMAIFVVVSHFSVAGLHNAAFRDIALSRGNVATIMINAVLASLPFALAAAACVWFGAKMAGDLLDSPATGRAAAWMAPALLLFGVNKIGLATLNALTLMRRYALGQMLRYATIALAAVTIALVDETPERLGIAFTVSEIAVSLYLVVATLPVRAEGVRRASRSEVTRLLRFGLRSMAAGFLTELNLRIDILMLGWYLPDRQVGIYAFAAILIEGFVNAALAVRSVVNPRLARVLAAGDEVGLRRLTWSVQAFILPIPVIAFFLTLVAFTPVVRLLFGAGDLEQALVPLLILVAMMTPYFAYAVFEEALMLSGRAGMQSLYQLTVTLANAALNLVLIPLWGIAGAAMATGAASIMACIILVATIRRVTGHWLVPWMPRRSALY